ncbi:MAG: hypothetical protein HQM16_07170 [Deltaproteobacteria bacterium]|nr:hypothetical protein [Deltaproteobacteria bacterium]
MSFPEKKNDFQWEEGQVLDNKDVAPVHEVRSKGLPKLSKAVHADPVKRKEERDKAILNTQSRVYSSKTRKQKDNDIIIEETHSGLSANIEKDDTKRLMDKGQRIRGLDRFGHNIKDKDKEK